MLIDFLGEAFGGNVLQDLSFLPLSVVCPFAAFYFASGSITVRLYDFRPINFFLLLFINFSASVSVLQTGWCRVLIVGGASLASVLTATDFVCVVFVRPELRWAACN